MSSFFPLLSIAAVHKAYRQNGKFYLSFFKSVKLPIVLFLFSVTYVVRMAVAHFLCSLVADPHYSKCSVSGSFFLVLVLCSVSEGMSVVFSSEVLSSRC